MKIGNKVKKEINIDILPRQGKKIDWISSIGMTVPFVYDDIEGSVDIVDYEHQYLIIKYLDKPLLQIRTNCFLECQLGSLFNERTSKFKIKIGTIFKDSKRDIIITDREYRTRYRKNGAKCNDKYYKYTCYKCGWTEGWVLESPLLGKQQTGCSCCTSQTIVLGINTIWDTDRWMCDLGLSEEDAKTHTRNSGDMVNVICPDCKKYKSIRIGSIYRTHSIGCGCKQQ